jgi:hypothetical protein
MAQVDSWQPLTMEAEIQSQTSLCGIYGVQSSTGTGFLQVLLFPLLLSFHQCSVLIHLSPMLYNLNS